MTLTFYQPVGQVLAQKITVVFHTDPTRNQYRRRDMYVEQAEKQAAPRM